MSTDTTKPADWKTYDQFALGIATNRLPPTDALAGQALVLALPGLRLTLKPRTQHALDWQEEGGRNAQGQADWYEAIEVAPGTFFLDITQASRPTEALTVVLDTRTRRVLAIRCRIVSAEEAAGQPRVPQDFWPGTLEGGAAPTGVAPHPTRDLIGLRTWQTYSPNHTYEHTYLSAERYAWQCLVGVQRGHGDVDLASYWKFGDEQYVFTFREFLIPVASVFFFDFARGRSTGKFLGVTSAGEVANNPAGAFMRKASQTFYPPDFGPV